MARSSAFQDFMASLRKRWRTEMPNMRPLGESLGPLLPKASSFYAGVSQPLAMHVYIRFQHSVMAWEVGQFTVNFVLSRREGKPEGQGGPFAPAPSKPFTEGNYRIGGLVGERDKWWRLRNDQPASDLGMELWRPTSYEILDAVLDEAVTDVTRDVRAALAMLGFTAAQLDMTDRGSVKRLLE